MISVVLPIYKPDPVFLKLALKSIDNQKVNREIEVVLADNGGGEYCENWAGDFSNFSFNYFRNYSKKGIFSNINFILEKTQGEYIHFFCQDDYLYPSFLEKMSNVLDRESNVGMVYNQYYSFSEDDQLPIEIASEEASYKVIPRELAINAYFRYGCFPGNLSTVMIRREVITKVGYFNENFIYCGDFEYWVRVAQVYNQAILIHRHSAIRQHIHQASNVLGINVWLKESIKIYNYLLNINTIQSPIFLKKLYINQELGSFVFRAIIKLTLKGSLKQAKDLFKLVKPPLSFVLICAIQIFSIMGSYKVFDFKKVHF